MFGGIAHNGFEVFHETVAEISVGLDHRDIAVDEVHEGLRNAVAGTLRSILGVRGQHLYGCPDLGPCLLLATKLEFEFAAMPEEPLQLIHQELAEADDNSFDFLARDEFVADHGFAVNDVEVGFTHDSLLDRVAVNA